MRKHLTYLLIGSVVIGIGFGICQFPKVVLFLAVPVILWVIGYLTYSFINGIYITTEYYEVYAPDFKILKGYTMSSNIEYIRYKSVINLNGEKKLYVSTVWDNVTQDWDKIESKDFKVIQDYFRKKKFDDDAKKMLDAK